ncbi:MFS transporter [Cellulomonas oligotrophica]|uniref:MFS family permease n=1 Tax=Cellulomonas oligotrophica TaxID=931536 RepID=A0A7Y9FEX3_9CELL|nr:MFS transporter [Cellulomonas oligotrophica]NYD85994.1 MFS family permease [Cellulomonas oligotrophica]GIG30999.1 hypothetical protein Col01nite_01580 [Cellulomonas oligotrophica]
MTATRDSAPGDVPPTDASSAAAASGTVPASRAPEGDESGATALRSRHGLLASALLLVELVAGMQTYLLSSVMPLVAGDLDAQRYYGVLTAAPLVATFLTMPLGPWLLSRVQVSRLLLWLTAVSIGGGLLSALAPDAVVFVLGRVVSGAAAGALASVSLSAVVTVLPPRLRRLVLAGYNAMWVLTSIAGPAYAAWVASALSWRWALVLYLPLLVVARVVVARALRGEMEPTGAERPPVVAAVALAVGVAVVSALGLVTSGPVVVAVMGLVGTAVVLVTVRTLLPAGTLRLARGRPAALGLLGLLTFAYFGASNTMAIVVHDVLGAGSGAVAVVLGAAGLGWAVLGLLVSRFPAADDGPFVRRCTWGALALALGLATCAAAALLATSWVVVLVGWTLAGVGIGAVYLDTLNRVVDVPPEVDGVDVRAAATAAVLVEAVATALAAGLAAALLGLAVDRGDPGGPTAWVLGALAVVALIVVPAARRSRLPVPV